MPTAAKLVAAILFAAVAFVAADAYRNGLSAGSGTGLLSPVSAFVGLVSGWLVMGRLVGGGMIVAAGQGLRTSVTIFVWVLLIFSVTEMLRRSTRLFYKDPLEALLSVFDLMVKYAGQAATPQVIVVLILGGIVSGIAAEQANRLWS